MDQSLISSSLDGDYNENINDSVIIKKQFEATVSEKLKRNESQQLKEKILNFIRDIQQNKYPNDDLPTVVVEKVYEIEEEFQLIWNEPEEVLHENGEFFEKIITKPIYNKLITLFDEQRDKKLEFSFKVFDFVTLKHLETDEEVGKHGKFEIVIQQIQKIDSYPAPRDKLQCIMNACKLISTIVNSTSKQSSPSGADNFLPVLIYAVLQSRPLNPFSNIQFITYFRSPRRIQGPEEYYLTAYESALEFIESIDHNNLKINADEFKKLCSERVEGIKYDEYAHEEGQFQFDAYQNYINLQMLRMKLQEVQKVSKFQHTPKKQKLRFANKTMQKPQEINLQDLPEFYQEYQLLYKNHLVLQKLLDGVNDYTGKIIKESHIQRNKQKQVKRFFGLL